MADVAAPLQTPGERTMRLQGDRRGCSRAEVVGQLWGSVQAVQALHFRNIGPGGALVEAGRPLPVSSVQRLRLSVGGARGEVEARVAHVEPGAGPDGRAVFVIGLEFTQVAPGIAAEIDALVAAPPDGEDDAGA